MIEGEEFEIRCKWCRVKIHLNNFKYSPQILVEWQCHQCGNKVLRQSFKELVEAEKFWGPLPLYQVIDDH